MFDFSPTGILVALAVSLWAALSRETAIALVAALACLVLVRLSRGSPMGRALWTGLAVAFGAFALMWQVAATDGATRMLARNHALAVRAERERADKAEAITRDLAEQSTRDLAETQADALHLKELNDDLSKNGRRDGVCLDRGLARRLRAL